MAMVNRVRSSWSLPILGARIGMITVDHAVSLSFFSNGEHVGRLRLDREFVVSSADGRRSIVVPSEKQSLTPVLQLFEAVVGEATADGNGTLRVRFENGEQMDTTADADFEAWEYAGSGGELFISCPGGGVSHFPGKKPNSGL